MVSLADNEELRQKIQSLSFQTPGNQTMIYKDECSFCFKTPFFKDGLFICLNSFHSFCRGHLELYVKKSGRTLFLQVESKKVAVDQKESPERIGQPNSKVAKLTISEGPIFSIVDSYHVIRVPDIDVKVSVNDDLGEALSSTIKKVVDATSAERLQLLSTSSNAWDDEIKIITKHKDLEQHNNGVTVPYNGWVCGEEGCGLTENLWLCLTDGAIRCGRSQFIGEGKKIHGNGHMKVYYEYHKYPLVVKLGTISSILDSSDVYSYDEDDAVLDPNLYKHLAHFGLDANKMKKTEKSTVEMELDINEKWEWSKCQEDDVELKNAYGPGNTGIINLGSTCYMNSVLQALIQVKPFVSRYSDKAQELFSNVNVEQIDSNFNFQLTKVISSLTSGEFAVEGSDLNGIKPRQFKQIAAGGHREFATAKQQDVEEYVRHLLEKVSENTTEAEEDPSYAFRFKTENRFEDIASGKVRYSQNDDVILQLPIAQSILHPIDGQENRYTVSMDDALQHTFEKHIVEGYKSPITGEVKGATNTLKFATFPDYLLVQVQKFAYADNGTLKKLDIEFDIKENLDLSAFRGVGKKPEEELLPEDAPAPAAAPTLPPYDKNIVSQITAMGFTENSAIKAAIACGNSADAAIEWVMSHLDDPTINDPPVPVAPKPAGANVVDPAKIEQITCLGFTTWQAKFALKKNPDVAIATDWLFNHVDEVGPEEEDKPAPPPAGLKKKDVKDGAPTYKLIGLISHMGSRPDSGHYVAHMLKNNQWILFNDEKVAVSVNTPKKLAYVYLYERISA